MSQGGGGCWPMVALACKPEKVVLFPAFARMYRPIIAILNLASQWHSNNNTKFLLMIVDFYAALLFLLVM